MKAVTPLKPIGIFLLLISACRTPQASEEPRIVDGTTPIRMDASARYHAKAKQVELTVEWRNCTDRPLLVQVRELKELSPHLKWSVVDEGGEEVTEGEDMFWRGTLTFVKLGTPKVDPGPPKSVSWRDNDMVIRTLKIPYPDPEMTWDPPYVPKAPMTVSVSARVDFRVFDGDGPFASIDLHADVAVKSE